VQECFRAGWGSLNLDQENAASPGTAVGGGALKGGTVSVPLSGTR
jgi:hypothetical protein